MDRSMSGPLSLIISTYSTYFQTPGLATQEMLNGQPIWYEL